MACRGGTAIDEQLVALLVAAGASVNRSMQAPQKPLLKPLHLAARACSLRCVRALLQARADPM